MLVDNQRQEESLHEAEESKTLGRQDPQVDELNELIERSYLKMNRIDEALFVAQQRGNLFVA